MYWVVNTHVAMLSAARIPGCIAVGVARSFHLDLYGEQQYCKFLFIYPHP